MTTPQGPADLVLLGGTVHTVDREDRTAEAVAVRAGRVQAVGDSAEIRAHAGEHTEVVDLGGRTLVPGFTDAHVHLEMAATALSLMTSIHSPPFMDIPSMLDGLREACRDREPGEWVIGQGNMFQDQRFAERRYPTRAELDSVSREHPIVLRHGAHVTVCNSRALVAFGTDAATEPPPGGVIVREEDGSPTGVFMEMYKYLPIPPFTSEQKRAAIPPTAREYFLRYGVTCVGEVVDSREGMGMLRALSADGSVPLRLALYARIPNPIDLDALVATGLRSGFGDDHCYLAGVKAFADGFAHTAATYEPHPGTDSTGKLVWSEGELAGIVRSCNEAGLQAMIHCAGDRAMDLVTEAYAAELEARPREDHRWRIEHIGNPFATDERLARMREVGVLPVPNPPHLYSIGDQFAGLVGEERAERLTMRLRTLVDLGLRPAGSSDLTGSHPESSNPFMGMWHAVVRETFGGHRFPAAEALTAREALRMYTLDAAFAVRQEHVRGSIEPGKLADLVVCDRDPLVVPDDDLRHVRVLATYVDGRPVWQAA